MFYVDKNWKNISAEESSAYMLFTAYGLEYFGSASADLRLSLTRAASDVL